MDAPASLGLGIASGLAAAASSAVSYLVSRHHGSRTGGDGLRLLVPAHALMGLVCLPLAWLLWPDALPPAWSWVPPLLVSTACYLAGQACVYAALMRMPASRLAPLLGLKLVMLAAIVSCPPGAGLRLPQWIAVLLAAVAALLLFREDARAVAGPPRPGGLAVVLTGCLLFAISDLGIVGLIDALDRPCAACCPPLGRLHAGGLAMSITYVLCGALALCFVPRVGLRDRRDWIAAGQYATAWVGGMVALYTCFGTVGVVLGNILQSTRGIMAVVAGAILAHLGWHDLEERVDRATFVRRLVAAGLMTSAIALFVSSTR